MIDIMENQVIGPAIRHGIEQGIPRGMRSILSPPCRYPLDAAMEDALDCAANRAHDGLAALPLNLVACAGTSDVVEGETSRQLRPGRLAGP